MEDGGWSQSGGAIKVEQSLVGGDCLTIQALNPTAAPALPYEGTVLKLTTQEPPSANFNFMKMVSNTGAVTYTLHVFLFFVLLSFCLSNLSYA